MKKKTFREIRTECGLTTSYVANKIGICVATLLAKERGERSFNAIQVQKLCALYNVNVLDVKF